MSRGFLHDQNPTFCENVLIKLFNDDSKEVRDQASRCFFEMEENLLNFENLINGFITSKAFVENSHDLIYQIKKITINSSNIRIFEKICNAFVETYGIEDSRARLFSYDSKSVFEIIMDLYNKNKNSQTLDLIDRFLMLPDISFSDLFAKYERSMYN